VQLGDKLCLKCTNFLQYCDAPVLLHYIIMLCCLHPFQSSPGVRQAKSVIVFYDTVLSIVSVERAAAVLVAILSSWSGYVLALL